MAKVKGVPKQKALVKAENTITDDDLWELARALTEALRKAWESEPEPQKQNSESEGATWLKMYPNFKD